ncbi:MAG: hypothetical protein M3314_10900 [Actinomycetota bacterium]|nr:hypothetical protein [Actinomycetota bacterium]
MKKFIAAGVGVLASVSLVLGASAVSASPADPIVDEEFCLDLGVTTGTSGAGLEAANTLLGVANGDIAAKRAILDSAVVAWVQAFGDHLLELDKVDGTPDATQAILNAAAADVTDAVGPWGQAKLNQWTAQHNADIAAIAHLMNTTLQASVCV